ncbi:putative WW domain-containing protein [Helianthus annuus]|nr:putative WW domain-containing protein [Helianthus annuus]
MGKRKERRLNAKSAANRRVKLDLLPEPSGDFGDSSNQEDVGVGGNGKNHAGSPNSPSSSDRKPENPLLLLGQYSDEEGEEESSKEVNHGARENTPTVLDEQVKVDNHDSTGADVDEKLLTEKVDQEKKPYPVDVLPNLEKTVEDDKPEPLHRDTDTLDRASVSLTSEMQTTGDVDSGWKMVLHEESNSYYYWNVATGETSWETPDVLTRGNESAYDPKSVPEIEETHATYVDAQANNECTNGVTFEAKENDNSGIELNVHNGNYTDIMANDIDEGVATQACDGLSNVEAHRNDSVFQDMGCHGGESSDAFRLLELCESLSERLKSLEGPEGFGDQISKLKFELDIRLADIKSLVPYGSSLLPFWLHSENQLKNLESSINNEVLKHLQRTSSGEINDPKTRFLENIGEYHENQVPTDIDPNAGHHSVEDEAPPQPSDMQTTQPYSYGEQYSFTYPGSGFDYYGQTNTAISSNGYYVDANGSHIPAPLPNVYYAPVLNPETATYYTLQDGMISTVPAVSGVETSLQSSVYGNIISDPIKSSTVVSSVSASSHVPESSSVTHGVSVVSASSVASTETVPKVQPKVTRIKKRTVAAVPTLRSNKKVSGLVDKWKAVKEELHEDEEDEPENALEILEKKRQREIEQWHAQQIASGEAKDNANFQPLGGDWRERVRRKRAKKSTQAEENLATNATDETKQQPNLAEISKQLPTGWQAYWDESSKQVYYGNSKTSETTWTKPTK